MSEKMNENNIETVKIYTNEIIKSIKQPEIFSLEHKQILIDMFIDELLNIKKSMR